MQEKSEILDVVEQFTVPNQTEAYNADYKAWRRNASNAYAFAFKKHSKESTFSDNKAILKESPSRAEQLVLTKMGKLYGSVLILYLFLENVLERAILLKLDQHRFHIDQLFLGASIFQDARAVFIARGCASLAKYVIPALAFFLILRMPPKVSYPLKMVQKQQFLLGFSLVMLLSTGLSKLFVSSSLELEKYRLISDSKVDEDSMMYAYLGFTVIVLPILSEFLIHGPAFQALRQFGDGFALWSTALVTAVMRHNVVDAFRILVISITISYFVLQTGSFLTAVVLRVLHESFMFVLYDIHNFGSAYSPEWWVISLLPAVVGIPAVIFMLLHDPVHKRKPAASGYLKPLEKATAFLSSFPSIALLVTCIVLFVTDALLR